MRSKANAQVNVGIPRDSPMHKFYLEEARSHGVKLPTYIYQLLKERYEVMTSGIIHSWMPIVIQQNAPAPEPQPEKENAEIDAMMVLDALGGEDD